MKIYSFCLYQELKNWQSRGLETEPMQTNIFIDSTSVPLCSVRNPHLQTHSKMEAEVEAELRILHLFLK